jgi:hypothetical protein
MEVKRSCKDRAISRSFEPNRMEEELWALAYEQVWPVIRRVVRQRDLELPDNLQDASTDTLPVARSA